MAGFRWLLADFLASLAYVAIAPATTTFGKVLTCSYSVPRLATPEASSSPFLEIRRRREAKARHRVMRSVLVCGWRLGNGLGLIGSGGCSCKGAIQWVRRARWFGLLGREGVWVGGRFGCHGGFWGGLANDLSKGGEVWDERFGGRQWFGGVAPVSREGFAAGYGCPLVGAHVALFWRRLRSFFYQVEYVRCDCNRNLNVSSIQFN